MDRQRRTHCMASTLARFVSSVGPPTTLVYSAPVDNEEALTIALWMPVRLSATTPASLHGLGGPWWDVSQRALNLRKDISGAYYKCMLSAITHKLNIFSSFVVFNSCPKIFPHLSFTLCIKIKYLSRNVLFTIYIRNHYSRSVSRVAFLRSWSCRNVICLIFYRPYSYRTILCATCFAPFCSLTSKLELLGYLLRYDYYATYIYLKEEGNMERGSEDMDL
jgi:hypothetical protein